MNKKMIASLMIILLAMNSSVYASTQAADTKSAITNESSTQASDVEADANEKIDEEATGELITLNDAVEHALKNSILLDTVKNQADIAKLVKDNAPDVRDKLTNSENELISSSYLIDDGRDQLYDKQAQLGSAQSALESGIAPSDIPVVKPELGLDFVIKAGSNIKSSIVNEFKNKGIPEDKAEAYADQMLPTIIDSVQGVLKGNSSELEANKKKLETNTAKYLSSKSQYDAALQYAMSNVANKLSTSTISSLKTKPLADLVVKMANTQDEVTSYSINIYKNKIALLVQNSYYEALKQQKLLEVKQKAVERGKLQYELAQAAYEVGAKSKDDMILAKTYYNSTIMSEEVQRKDYNAALITLKTNMNIDLGKEIRLEEVPEVENESYDLAQGINSGKRVRLEVKMANAQKDLYCYLKTAVEDSDYNSSDNQYKEVELLKKKADITIKGAELQVESDIRTSYSTMTSMQKVAAKAKELEADAKETVEIAKVKYEVGFGYDNALLSQLNLESMSGTLVEVIAAEENLVNIQEKQIEAVNGYNLSRLKYLNDIGVLPYK